jgi:tRNA pseudouridine55 synthase
VEHAHTVAEISSAAAAGTVEELLLPVDSVFSDLPSLTVSEGEAARLRCGSPIPFSDERSGRARVYAPSGEFLLVGAFKNGALCTEKSFFEVQ